MSSSKWTATTALSPLEVLFGRWDVQIRWSPKTHEMVGGPITVHASAQFDWIEDGHFLIQRQGANGGPSEARLLMGGDDTSGEFSVLYGDGRGVSRVYQMSFGDRVWRMWRNAPGFNQRFEGRLSTDGRTIEAHWEKSTTGDTWEHDFDLTYTKAD